MLHPITFSIPCEKLCQVDVKKTKILSDLIPGDISTYIYHSELEYYQEYQTSFFATTTRKAGWDCLRHYEILANKCVPYFPDIEHCPKNTLALFPKELFVEANQMVLKLKEKTVVDLTEEELTEYTRLQQQWFAHTKNNLTTVKVADYILRLTKHEKATNILYLSYNTQPDYLRCLTLHGFKTSPNVVCVDFPKIPHIYKSPQINYNVLYGKGFTYTNLIEDSTSNEREKVEENIAAKHFDLVVYGSYHRGMPFYALVEQHYLPNEIILLCGEDMHRCDYTRWLQKGHHVFVREL